MNESAKQGPASQGPATATESVAVQAARTRLEERVAGIESILISVPMLLLEIALILSLFVPYASQTKTDEDPESFNLFFFLAGFADRDDDGDPEAASILFASAFLVLIVVIIGTICTAPMLAGKRVSSRAGATAVTFIIVLILGNVGAWMVMLMGVYADSPWTIGPALPLLNLGTLLAAMIAFMPGYRRIWER